jgi:hypothetical protein
MDSEALKTWKDSRIRELNQLAAIHNKIGGPKAGRRYATEQLNHAYLVAVSAQFQGYCRDLHTEATFGFVDHLKTSRAFARILTRTLTKNRKLAQKNPSQGAIAEDFGFLGMEDFWRSVEKQAGTKRTKQRLKWLEKMNIWRNAIAHNDFELSEGNTKAVGGRLRPRLTEVKNCRKACEFLAEQMASAWQQFLADLASTREPR